MAANPPVPHSDPSFSPSGEGDRRLGSIRLTPGTRPGHVLAYIFVSLACVSITGFFPLMQPFVLSQGLGMDRAHIGSIAGNLALTQNMAVLVCTIVFGAIADRWGRRTLLAFAGFGMAVAAWLYPLAGSLSGLAAIMFLLGMAQTGLLVGGATVAMDYPVNASRGKYVSLMLVIQIAGAAVLVGQCGVRLPVLLTGLGFQGFDTIRLAFWAMACLGLPAGWAAMRLMRPDVSRAPPVGGVPGEIRAVARGLRDVLRYTRAHPPFQLVLLMALTMRADFAVVTTFMSLWLSDSAAALGIAPAAAVARVGTLYSIVLGGNLVATLLMGYLIDRVDRIVLLIGALCFVCVAMTLPVFVTNPFLPIAFGVALVLGLAEGIIIVPSMALLGQEAPAHLRGSAAGIFSLVAIVGVSLINFTGGWLFDHVGVTAPFLLMACVNLVLLVRAIAFWRQRAS